MDRKLSRRHFQIRFEQNRWCLKDLWSHNGTQINNVAVTQSVVQDGDLISAGDCRFLVEIVHEHPVNVLKQNARESKQGKSQKLQSSEPKHGYKVRNVWLLSSAT